MCSYIILPKALFFCYDVPLSNAKNSSRRKLKLFAKNFEFLREQFFVVLAESQKSVIILLLQDLKALFLLLSFSLSFLSFLSSPLVLLAHT